MMVSGIRADSVTEHRSFTNGIGAITANGTADKRLPGDLLNGDSSGAGRAEYAAISREAGAIIAAVFVETLTRARGRTTVLGSLHRVQERTMIHHLGIVVTDFTRSKQLYDACLEPLGIHRTETDLDWAIYAPDGGQPFLWLGSEIPSYWRPGNQAGNAPLHIAFIAPDRAAVDAFYSAALEHGADDNGPPGLRVGWGHFYSAYILDLDGNNIEATIREK